VGTLRRERGVSILTLVSTQPTLVDAIDDLQVNLATFDRLGRDRDNPEHEAYLGFVRRGHCFLPYEAADDIAFAPSRLVGYKENTLERHARNEAKDGRDTDPAITRIVGATYSENTKLERAYHRFCHPLGLDVHARTRKWPVLALAGTAMRPRALPSIARFEIARVN
jgi:hypothetical protein